MSGGSATGEFPPLERTSFIGRRGEVSLGRQLLSRGRLETLTGPGGIGKTRLALRIAADVRRVFAGGVWLVELASLDRGGLLAQTVADALGLRESRRPPVEALHDFLSGRQALLVLDNCEHLAEACAELVTELLDSCGSLKIMATSRHVLRVPGEVVLDVPPLSLPAPDPGPDGGGHAVAHCESVSLFYERAALLRPDFSPTRDRDRAVAEICRRLDGFRWPSSSRPRGCGSCPRRRCCSAWRTGSGC